MDGLAYYHGDTPVIGVFYSGQEWLELLQVLLVEKMVRRKQNGDGTYTYFPAKTRKPRDAA